LCGLLLDTINDRCGRVSKIRRGKIFPRITIYRVNLEDEGWHKSVRVMT
jgi:hypothetical protein